MNRAVLLCIASLASAQPPDAGFRSETRLVEIDVVVRTRPLPPAGLGAKLQWIFDSGPPYGPPGEPLSGLGRGDFTLLDNGKPQTVVLFHSGRADDDTPFPFPAGAVSNRISSHSPSSSGATVILLDLLNTPWGLTEYARAGAKQLARFMSVTDPGIAVYSLGKRLHVLRDFGGDPAEALDMEAVLRDYGDPPTAFVDWGERSRETTAALAAIIRHLEGVPGRKSLVWMSQGPAPPPAVTAMLRQANVVLYPVAVRGAPSQDNGTASGGRRFFDALDLGAALETARQDSGAGYVLGYYPTEEMLDGKQHSIVVKLDSTKVRQDAAEIHYRSEYIASKTASVPAAPSLGEIVFDPLDATGIGLAAQAAPSVRAPGLFDVSVTVDLHDVHLDRAGDRFKDTLEYAVPSSEKTFKAGSVALNLSDTQMASALENGFTLLLKGVEAEDGRIRVAIRDRATGVAGAVQVPVAKP